MKIGIIDADLLGRRKHRFPNLACEKISGFWKAQNAEVALLMDYNWSDNFDHIYVSKVFTDTPGISFYKFDLSTHRKKLLLLSRGAQENSPA